LSNYLGGFDMAKAKATTGEARVLVDLPSYGAKAGNIISAPVAVIKALADAGEVDPHPEAVDYAKSVSAEVVAFDPDAKAEEAAGE
jgi:hypothetical protein